MVTFREPYFPDYWHDETIRPSNYDKDKTVRLIEFRSTVRVKKEGVYYELIVADRWEGELSEDISENDRNLLMYHEIFHKKCLMTVFFFEPIGATKVIGPSNHTTFEPSTLQISEKERLKKRFIDDPTTGLFLRDKKQ